MKIKNSKIFTADVYDVCNYKEKVTFEFDGCCLGNRSYDERLSVKNAIVVKFAHMYVPVCYVDNIFKYLDVKSHETKDGIWGPDKRFLGTICTGEDQYVKNVKPFTDKAGKTDVKTLLNIHRENFDKTQQGGMEIKL